MIRFFILFLLCVGAGNTFANSFTFNILGYTYQDSNQVNIERIYQTVLDKSIYLGEKLNTEKGYPKIRKSTNKTGVFLLSVLLLYAFAGVRLMFSHQFAGSLDILKNLRNHNKGQTESDSISLLSFYGLFSAHFRICKLQLFGKLPIYVKRFTHVSGHYIMLFSSYGIIHTKGFLSMVDCLVL
jgi:hypothetical protein